VTVSRDGEEEIRKRRPESVSRPDEAGIGVVEAWDMRS
jgi:hypothetical protein